MPKSSVIRIWVTNKNNREITAEMNESMVSFLSIATEHGCIGSTFAEDDERVIVYTKWRDEMTLEQFRSSKSYEIQEGKIIQSFSAAGFEIPDDILFNSTAKILFGHELESIPTGKEKRARPNITPMPKIALGYVPFAFALMFLASFGSDGFGGYYIFIYSGMWLWILLPIYSVYLVFHTWQRYKNGTLTFDVMVVHALSFIIPFAYLLLIMTFNGSPA